MPTAPVEVQAVARYIAPVLADEGVARMIEMLVLAAPSAARPSITLRSAWRSALTFRPRFVYLQVAPAHFFAIESSHGLGRFLIVGHFHERKPSRPAGFPVHGHVHASDLPKWREQIAQLAFRSLKTHVADKQTLHLRRL